MYLPYWINQKINQDEVSQIQEAIKQAELKTQAEIVPMVVKSSSVEFKEFKLAYVFCVLATVVTVNPLFFILIYILHLINKKIKQQNVYQRAVKEFYNSAVNGTKAKTGVLVLVSLNEKQVVILADNKISDFVSPQTWTQLVDDLITKIKQDKLAEGLTLTIGKVGEVCSQIAPSVTNDVNELSDKLVIKE